MLDHALEKKDKTTRDVAASDGLGFSSDTQNHHICQNISVYVRLPSSRHSVQSVRLNRGGRGGRGVGVLWVSDVRFQYDCNELLLLSHEV